MVYANTSAKPSMAIQLTSSGFAVKRELTELGRVGSSFTRLIPPYQSCARARRPPSAAIDYWADGLEPIYLERALARAQGRLLWSTTTE
jgi:hypothetical protein